jgi:hypothetical protein
MPYTNGIHQMPVSAYAAPEEPEKDALPPVEK